MRAEIITMLIYSDKYLLNINTVWKHFQVFLPLDSHTQHSWWVMRENSRQGAGSGSLACIGYLWRAPDGWLGGPTLAIHRALCIAVPLCQHVSALPRRDLLSDPPCWDCQQSCQVSPRQSPLTCPVYWRSVSAVRFLLSHFRPRLDSFSLVVN